MADYDRLCIESWIDCGFRVLALNTPDEIPHLAARYTGVDFVSAKRTAQPIFGRNTPFIADMMSVLAIQPEPVLGILNCDILFEPVSAWRGMDAMIAQKTVVTGQRLDARSLTGGALHQYFPGFDYFFFDHAAADALAQTVLPFSMGLPWWDYWFPLCLAFRGYELRNVTKPAVLHLAHESRTEARTSIWRRLAVEFARSVVRESGMRNSAPANTENLIALSRLVDKATDAEIEGGTCDAQIIRLSELSVPIIGGTPIQLDDTAFAASAPSVSTLFFDGVPNRVEAGHALHQAMWEERLGRMDVAEARYGTALKKAPHDPGVLSACGNFFLRRGDMDRAATLLCEAVELVPDSAWLLNCLGSTLGQAGRVHEAIACFERALAADPLDGTSYYNLAMALYPSNRHGEIVGRLETMLRNVPDFPDGPLWLRRLRESLPRNG